MSARGGSAWARKNNRDGGMSAAAFGATFSSAGRISPVVLAPRGCLPWEGDPERGTYAVTFDASRGTVKRTPRFVVTYNGKSVPGAEHASMSDAWVAAHQLSKTCATDIRCFSVVSK